MTPTPSPMEGKRNEEIARHLAWSFFEKEGDRFDAIKEAIDAKDIIISEQQGRIERIRDLVLDDVPHIYQDRLLEALK